MFAFLSGLELTRLLSSESRTLHSRWNGSLKASLNAFRFSGLMSGATVETLAYSRKNPFPATMLVNRRITGGDSEKDVRHIELSLEGSGFLYEPGDSLGVIPTNCPEVVDDLIATLNASGMEEVPGNDGRLKPFREALLHDYHITQPARQFIAFLAEHGTDSEAAHLKELLLPERAKDLEKYLWGTEYIDFLQRHPQIQLTPQELVSYLRKLQPRLYSIASSSKVHPQSVHLTVAVVRYETYGRRRKGVASTYLADRLEEDTHSPCFIHSAKGFRLPPSADIPVIMVGPGTGVAPFRAFLQERKALGAQGPNWLFFGGQHESCDFLYGEELRALHAQGFLTRLDTAFSRDQEHKVYVQHRMLENAAEIWRWLEQGAYFYICGDAQRMAKDVEAALHAIVEEQGGHSSEDAAAYLEELKKSKRLRKDVY